MYIKTNIYTGEKKKKKEMTQPLTSTRDNLKGLS